MRTYKRKYSAIAGGQVGAWQLQSRDATRSQVEGAGFNLNNSDVQEVIKFAR